MAFRPQQIIRVSSLDDPRIADYRAIRDRDLIRQKGLFIVEGENPVLRLLASQYATASLLVSDKRLARIAPSVPDNIPLYTAPETILEQAPGFSFNRGVIACGIRRPLPSLEDLLLRIKPPATLVVCAGIGDAENLGQIIRSCAALGVAGLLLGGGTIDPFYRRVVRVSMGALFTLPLAGSTDLAADLRRVKESGYRLFATYLSPAATPLRQVHPVPLSAILLGNEGSGLPAELAEAGDERITIPMQAGVDSLNVAAAAAIMIHHFTG
jgi:tRNA G18 (ribose-2'-O)-methylase SpoU